MELDKRFLGVLIVKKRYGEACIYAAQHNLINILYKFIPGKVDANFHTSHSITLLICASLFGNCEIVKFLLKNGADPKRESQMGLTALNTVNTLENITNNHLKIIELLEKVVDKKGELI